MVPFAGWEMPVHYAPGVMAEHLLTRSDAGLFDVSHMGQVVLRPRGDMAGLLRALEALTPADLLGLSPGRQRYALLTDDDGGILDDAMVAHRGTHLLMVVNASSRAADLAHLRAVLGPDRVEEVEGRCLIALQGPRAADLLGLLVPGCREMRFMDSVTLDWGGVELWVSRSGYTGEDGYEISVPDAAAEALAPALIASGAALAGLGARDSLRLEAGLPLYGSDIDRTTSPVEAGLGWSVGKARRSGGERVGGFPGAERTLREAALGPGRLRVGLRPDGRQPVRGGAALKGAAGHAGHVTSGGFGPTLQAPIAMGYVEAALAAPGTALAADVRGRSLAVTVTALPFVQPSFKR